MHDLEITWPTGQARFSPDDSPIDVGRAPDAAIILTEPSVSRRHIEFAWTGSAWAASDSSTHGSFDPIGVRLAPTWTVGTNTTIRLGGVEGVEIKIELVTTRPEGFDPHIGSPPPPLQVDEPPAPPGLADIGGLSSAYDPVQAPQPAAFDAPPPQSSIAPIAPDSPAAPPGAPSPPGFSGAPELPGEPDLPDAPRLPDAPGPGSFAPPVGDAPGLGATPPPPNDVPPAAPPSAFDAPSADPSPIFDPPAAAAPPSPPPAFDPPAFTPTPVDAPPPDPPLGAPPPTFDSPPQPPPTFDSPPQPPPTFDSPPQPPPSSEQPGFGASQVGDPSLGVPPSQPTDFGGPAVGVTGIIPDPSSSAALSDATIQLSVDGQDYTFLPGTEISVGRDPSSLVAVDERHSLVSRHHLKIAYQDDSWWIEDFSSKGTFVDGRQISGRYQAQGAFMAQLGDDDAGTPLRVIAAGEHKAPRKQNIALLIAIGILALIAVAALVLALTSRGDDNAVEASGVPTADTLSVQNTPPVENASASDLVAAKQATVLLLADEGLGSGFFVSENLIVTNQHVAALAPSLFVAVSRQADERAVVEYFAETVALHPFLDIAVMQLTTDLDGNPVDSSGLSAVPFDDTLSLTLGDEVYNTGFPANLSLISRDDMGELLLPPVGTNSGEAASFAIWPGCTNPDFASFIPEGSPAGVTCAPDGDVERGIVITTFSSGQGASGSPVFLDNEVIAVVFAGPLDDNSAGRNITTASFSSWLDGVITSNS